MTAVPEVVHVLVLRGELVDVALEAALVAAVIPLRDWKAALPPDLLAAVCDASGAPPLAPAAEEARVVLIGAGAQARPFCVRGRLSVEAWTSGALLPLPSLFGLGAEPSFSAVYLLEGQRPGLLLARPRLERLGRPGEAP